MAPTITSVMTDSKEDQTLTNKLRKPTVEKLQRNCISNSTEQLKSLLALEILNQQPDSKLEKADSSGNDSLPPETTATAVCEHLLKRSSCE